MLHALTVTFHAGIHEEVGVLDGAVREWLQRLERESVLP